MQHRINKESESAQLQFVFSETLLDVNFHLVLIPISTSLLLQLGYSVFWEDY